MAAFIQAVIIKSSLDAAITCAVNQVRQNGLKEKLQVHINGLAMIGKWHETAPNTVEFSLVVTMKVSQAAVKNGAALVHSNYVFCANTFSMYYLRYSK